MDNLKKAKELYKFGTEFYSATGNLQKFPLKVFKIEEVKHEDRKIEIDTLRNFIYKTWNTLHPTKFNKLDYRDLEFYNLIKTAKQRLDDLKVIPNDIINSEGGVIYCGLNDKWAQICQ